MTTHGLSKTALQPQHEEHQRSTWSAWQHTSSNQMSIHFHKTSGSAMPAPVAPEAQQMHCVGFGVVGILNRRAPPRQRDQLIATPAAVVGLTWFPCILVGGSPSQLARFGSRHPMEPRTGCTQKPVPGTCLNGPDTQVQLSHSSAPRQRSSAQPAPVCLRTSIRRTWLILPLVPAQ